MIDRRLHFANERVAHDSLKGQVEADTFVDGHLETVAVICADIMAKPDINGERIDRQLLLGEWVRVLEHHKGHAFVRSEKDGYVGWVSAFDLTEHALQSPTHVVASRSTHLYKHPDMKLSRCAWAISHGCRLTVAEDNGRFAKIQMPCRIDDSTCDGPYKTRFVPIQHLRPISQLDVDPIAVAELYLGAPYLWGGNSAFGIDCSGLVQAALLACGIACPGDSDMQEAELGRPLAEDEPLQRGDLLFWKGHVAMVVDNERLIHANAHHMAVAYEGIDEAIARIERQGDGPVTSRKRLEGLGHE
ncbi:NlpC/P60 family protein [Alisedimentitalea sp. MJ-SS2]|uniref:C40 family peptidase n=1 Tax=Aliisedimentitalea sp. MJ-SS2 TaxID=3049795 RepID=UPI00290A04D5|nr:NlpC/P60 family protein [Alisedimentitalea sp. MJ-SS2]MDU8928174.1 NlpC/P60 family protein [Alisedimentitalea sp. MJ-SS2]